MLLLDYLPALGWGALAVCLLIGVGISIFSPYRGFLFAVFISLAFSNDTLAFTRTAELGSYFNVYDACLVVMFFAFLWDPKPSLRLPKPVIVLSCVFIMGALNVLLLLGLDYSVLRNLRAVIVIPIMFFLAANLVRGEERVKALLVTLLAAAIMAEMQHLLFVVGARGAVGDRLELLRTVSFYMAGSSVWLVAGFYVSEGNIPRRGLQICLAVLFFLCNLSTETRSIFLGMAGGALLYYLWYLNGANAYRWLRFKGLFYALILGLLLAIPVGFGSFASHLTERYVGTVEGTRENVTRENTFIVETRDWLEGNWLIGRGIGYYKIHRHKRESGSTAFGHLGYIAYLSQLGIIGFVVYGFYFPATVLIKSRHMFKTSNLPLGFVHLCALTGALFLTFPVTFLFSGSFLQPHYLAGILPGAIWANPISEIQDNMEQVCQAE